MAVFLTILKWLGIILLVLLALILVILLIVLLVPIKYNARAAVEDPDRHEEFPVSVLRENSEVTARISWLLGRGERRGRRKRGNFPRSKS